jgi:hypothetical protein
MALMEWLQTKNPGGGANGGGGTFQLPPQGSHVVGGVVNGGFTDIITLGQYIMRGKAG